MSLTIFNEINGVFAGTNTPQFTQLEYLVTTAKKTSTVIPSLGLFGEASVGKTFSSELIAKFAGYHYLYFNASTLSPKTFYKSITKSFMDLILKDGSLYTAATRQKGTTALVYEARTPVLILVDEAHELHKDLQTLFLTLLIEKGVLNPDDSVSTISLRNVTWVFATTDSSKLLYPLTTRLFNITFDQYTKEDIMNIVRLKYKMISNGGLGILANCSKLVPRTAIRFAEQLTNMHPDSPITDAQTVEFVKNALAMDPDGIDAIDKRILLYLSNNKKKINPVDEISLDAFKQTVIRLTAKGVKMTNADHRELNRAKFNVAVLEQKINNAEFIAKSRQDISLACRVLDLGDLEKRLSYLEKLEFITKTSKGIQLSEKYR